MKTHGICTLLAAAWIGLLGCGGSSNDSNSCSGGAPGGGSGAGGLLGATGGGGGGTDCSCQSHLNTNSACGTCLEQHCCSQVTACLAEGSCAQCTSGGACSNDAPTSDLNGCIANSCTAECSAPNVLGGGTNGGPVPGSTCSLGIPFSQPACTQCVSRSCCSEDNACAGNSDCLVLTACVKSCPAKDTSCENQCAQSHPGGTRLLTALANCVTAGCKAACNP
jgi:hypothetical protein